MFKEFTGDSPEMTEAIVSHDWDRMLVHRVVKNDEQARRIKIDTIVNLTMLNEIYITLRSKSKFYPYLSPKDVEAFFAKDLGVERRNDMILKTTIHNFCLET